MPKNYKELKVWQKSYELCLGIYTITAKFPKEEIHGLTSQIRRSVVSIPSNIAKGFGYTKRRHRRNQKNVNGADKVFRKQTLEFLTP
jgi:four helix bundle protein